MEEQKDGLHINKEGNIAAGFFFSVSGTLGNHQYWRMGPFKTEDLAKEYINLLTKGGGRKMTKDDYETREEK